MIMILNTHLNTNKVMIVTARPKREREVPVMEMMSSAS